MTTEQKAKQLALSLIGEDQNPEPLIEVLIEMAQWQKRQMMKDAVDFEVLEHEWNGDTLIPVKGLIIGEKVKLIIIEED